MEFVFFHGVVVGGPCVYTGLLCIESASSVTSCASGRVNKFVDSN